ncbi:hypothetical protein DYB32_000349, partial [Aphanomyces invadans]
DHDGVLQRREFVKWSNKIRDAISPLLASDDSAVAPPFVTNERVKYDPTDDVNSGAKRVKSSVNKFWSGFISGIVTIWATEVGDKTFFIAAILSMKHDRIVVFAGAISALIVMTVLSVVLGGVAALLLPPWMTHYAGACLVQASLAIASLHCPSLYGHSVTRSFDYLLAVTLGAILGHSMCTGLAVVGGKFLASRISEKTVTVVGGVMFLIFAVHAMAFPPQE